jgi:hypothetical protein
MPLMQRSEMQNGRMRAYTLPANTMRLSQQENKEALLQQLKQNMSDKTMSFTFNTVGFFKKWKKSSLYKSAHQTFIAFLKLYKMDKEHLDEVDIDDSVWMQIRKGKFLPSKNLIFTLALVAHFSIEDTQKLLEVYGYDFDYAYEKDVVIAYLLTRKVFNADMVQAALAEYKIKHLFLKK